MKNVFKNRLFKFSIIWHFSILSLRIFSSDVDIENTQRCRLDIDSRKSCDDLGDFLTDYALIDLVL